MAYDERPMHEVSNPGGRIVLFRIVAPVSDDNSERAATDLRAQIVGAPEPVVVVSDVSIARVFAPETTARFVGLMKSDNPKIFRSALLYSVEAATLGLQLHRMLKEAESSHRRIFTAASELVAWLDPDLTDLERVALRRIYPSPEP